MATITLNHALGLNHVNVDHGVQFDVYYSPGGTVVAVNVDGVCIVRLILKPGMVVELNDATGCVKVTQ